MNIVIRTDSSVHIGSGHVMRNLVLAKELERLGHKVSFASRPQEGDSIDYIKQQGFAVHELAGLDERLIPKSSDDYIAWLQVPIQTDIAQFCSIIKSIDLVVVDHYALGAEWQEEIKSHYDCKIVAIDDLVREHRADIVIDQTLLRKPEEYVKRNNKGINLTGSEYALLHPKFTAKRELALDNNSCPSNLSVLLSMGGIDKDNVTLSVLKALVLLKSEKPKVTVLLSRKSPSYEDVKSFCMQHSDWTNHIDFSDNMADEFLAHAIAIGAPGTTAWERACLGVPSIIIPLAKNQRTIATNLVKSEAAILIEPEQIKTGLTKFYKTLVLNWSKYRRNSLKICDGLGVKRVSRYIDNLLLGKVNKVLLRAASTEDIEQVYMWQCRPETRKYALTSEIPTWDTHKVWMQNKLESVQDYFYIIQAGDTKEAVGVIRLDRIKSAEYLVSIFICPEEFGKGIAKNALQFIDDVHQHVTLHATVMEDNAPSQQLFITANYQRTSKDNFIRLPII